MKYSGLCPARGVCLESFSCKEPRRVPGLFQEPHKHLLNETLCYVVQLHTYTLRSRTLCLCVCFNIR